MSNHGEIMNSEISETPEIFAKLISANLFNESLSALLETSEIKSILILARGTSDNAAHFLKYLVETQLGLPCGYGEAPMCDQLHGHKCSAKAHQSNHPEGGVFLPLHPGPNTGQSTTFGQASPHRAKK